jgi:GNAT superfamily N-acetyltransferase
MRNDRGRRLGRADASRVQGSRLSTACDRRLLRAANETNSETAISRFDRTCAAAELGRITRTRPIPNNLLGDDAPFRQYVALDGEDIVGRVRSVNAVGATGCADMYVRPSHRRRGIGQALLSKMLQDDRARGSKCTTTERPSSWLPDLRTRACSA